MVCIAGFSARATENSLARLVEDPRCGRALAWIDGSPDWVTSQQVRLTEIPAPEFAEAPRAEAMREIFAANGFETRLDSAGNVIAERAGSDPHRVVLLAAHLDTVFPAGTDVRVRREGARLLAPGISDNGAGLGALAGLARALAESGLRTRKTIVLVGDLGEEGEGNLRGMRALVKEFGSRLEAVIAVDGPATDFITTQGVASRRIEAVVTGPGGHSWSDFGMPNPISAIARGIVRFTSVRLPSSARSTYNFGVIEGGTSVNSIPARAGVKVDLRSESEAEAGKLETELRQAMQEGVRDEEAAFDAPDDALDLSFRSLGVRPAGKLPADSPLLAAVREVDRFLGNRSRLERSSTDANLPLSLGIPAIALGGGGRGGGAHTLGEWYDPTGRELGLKRLFLTAVSVAGLDR